MGTENVSSLAQPCGRPLPSRDQPLSLGKTAERANAGDGSAGADRVTCVRLRMASSQVEPPTHGMANGDAAEPVSGNRSLRRTSSRLQRSQSGEVPQLIAALKRKKSEEVPQLIMAPPPLPQPVKTFGTPAPHNTDDPQPQQKHPQQQQQQKQQQQQEPKKLFESVGPPLCPQNQLAGTAATIGAGPPCPTAVVKREERVEEDRDPSWTDQDDVKMMAFIIQRRDWNYIAEKMGRDVSTVRRQMMRLESSKDQWLRDIESGSRPPVTIKPELIASIGHPTHVVKNTPKRRHRKKGADKGGMPRHNNWGAEAWKELSMGGKHQKPDPATSHPLHTQHQQQQQQPTEGLTYDDIFVKAGTSPPRPMTGANPAAAAKEAASTGDKKSRTDLFPPIAAEDKELFTSSYFAMCHSAPRRCASSSPPNPLPKPSHTTAHQQQAPSEKAKGLRSHTVERRPRPRPSCPLRWQWPPDRGNDGGGGKQGQEALNFGPVGSQWRWKHAQGLYTEMERLWGSSASSGVNAAPVREVLDKTVKGIQNTAQQKASKRPLVIPSILAKATQEKLPQQTPYTAIGQPLPASQVDPYGLYACGPLPPSRHLYTRHPAFCNLHDPYDSFSLSDRSLLRDSASASSRSLSPPTRHRHRKRTNRSHDHDDSPAGRGKYLSPPPAGVVEKRVTRSANGLRVASKMRRIIRLEEQRSSKSHQRYPSKDTDEDFVLEGRGRDRDLAGEWSNVPSRGSSVRASRGGFESRRDTDLDMPGGPGEEAFKSWVDLVLSAHQANTPRPLAVFTRNPPNQVQVRRDRPSGIHFSRSAADADALEREYDELYTVRRPGRGCGRGRRGSRGTITSPTLPARGRGRARGGRGRRGVAQNPERLDVNEMEKLDTRDIEDDLSLLRYLEDTEREVRQERQMVRQKRKQEVMATAAAATLPAGDIKTRFDALMDLDSSPEAKASAPAPTINVTSPPGSDEPPSKMPKTSADYDLEDLAEALAGLAEAPVVKTEDEAPVEGGLGVDVGREGAGWMDRRHTS
ncbi:unnamed protein product [Vitrella brassicaformis CCMP3155]|uniref:Uncharacterized protein n=2 Tax=Vitrella brassicaformis TaxID=1169539 RepID=A0A0G4EGK6_VITBC|nr:unnamed protein product [Vitrella brassicaformis CCMP3155]|eukprot:CEL94615.1 unnamed protein product [Vitrella brassicaformis CCMP3155]